MLRDILRRSGTRWGAIAAGVVWASAMLGGCPLFPREPEVETTDFNAFVKGLLAETSNESEPVDISGITFEFDNSDESAFDDVLAGAIAAEKQTAELDQHDPSDADWKE